MAGVVQRLRIPGVALCAALMGAAGGASAQQLLAAAGHTEFPRETLAIVEATTALFDAAEAVENESPTRPFAIGPIATPASAELVEGDVDAFRTENGPVRNLMGYRITWYPVERFLGAVDFMGTWDGNRNLVCGYVTWDLSEPDTPMLEAVSARYITSRDLDALAEDEVEAALLEANCAFGDLDRNFAAFRVE
ncbi:MAG: hypothetical protein QNJ35_06850 [Paracoccaceae bacterium]|nr:hypothetical protein [Paracoccaceae bacterium]